MTCPYCPHHCSLKEGQVGFCQARIQRNGKSEPLAEGRISALALDPIEKKPLHRFHPGSMILSVGGFGCNMRCFFCQNDNISMAGEGDIPTRDLPPPELSALAQQLAHEGNLGVAFTYNEPMITFEYIVDTARLLRSKGLKTVVVTNGNFCDPALEAVLDWVDAWNIDLKGFTEKWYQHLGGDLETVKAFISKAQSRAHVEITTLIVPGENDSAEEISALSQWLASLSPEIPLHLSRFFPCYHARDKAPTDKTALLRLCQVARNHLKYVYPGNI